METAFIDIVGQSSYTERARHYPISAQLEVMLAFGDVDDIHERFRAWEERFTAAIAPLRSTLAAVEDGGTKFEIKLDTLAQTGAQRYRRLTRRYRLLAPSSDSRDRLVEVISGLPFTKQETVDVMVPRPIFEASATEIHLANCDAVEDAHAKAAAVARASGGRVGPVLSVRQMPPHPRASGTFGDEDWWGQWDSVHIGGSGGLESEDPTHPVSVRFLVRFELIHDEPKKKKARRDN
jgi:hypothetical protein